MIINKGYVFLYFMTACLLLTPLSASARPLGLDALASLSYGAYESKTGLDHEKADSFSQNYSVKATKSGNLYNRRGGPYNLELFYNHQRHLTNVNNTKYSPSISFFEWSGDLKLSMPHLYGLTLNTYSDSQSGLERNESDLGDTNWGDFVYDLDLREEIKQSDFDLQLGVNGGPYYYLYHNNYKVDFSRVPDRSYSRIGMSVQYEVNWLHFFRDVESIGGKERRVFSLGNVGLPEKANSFEAGLTYFSKDRFWYRLTNWLQISTDFLFLDEKADNVDASTERATLAFKGGANRAYVAAFNTYERYDSSDVSRRIIALPFWADYDFSPSISAYFTNNYSESKSEDLATSAVTRSKYLKDTLTLISEKRDRYYLETGYSLKKSNDSTSATEAHSISFAGDTRLKGDFNYGLDYQYDTSKETYSKSSSHSLNGIVYYRLTQQTRMSLSQGYMSSSNQGKQSAERFNTHFSINNNSHGFKSYLNINRINSIKEGGAESMTYSMIGNAKKNINNRLNLTLWLSYSDEDIDGTDSDSESIDQASSAYITYVVARNLDSKTSLETIKSDISGAASSSYSSLKIREDLKYTYKIKGFSKRKLFDIDGMIEYQKSKARGSRYDQDAFKIGFNYYPTRPFSCGASYSHSSVIDLDTKSLYFALRYPLVSLTGTLSRTERSESYNLGLVKKF